MKLAQATINRMEVDVVNDHVLEKVRRINRHKTMVGLMKAE